jgi:AraC family transcriptional activator of pobA
LNRQNWRLSMREMFPYYSIGHFINEPNNLTEFEITEFQNMLEPEVEDPHKHTFYEIIWTDRGTSKQVIDYQEYDVRPGTLFFISPGQLHDFSEWQPIKGGSILFTEDFFLLNHLQKDKLFELTFLDNFYQHPILKPSKKSYIEVRHTIDLLLSENKRKDRLHRISQSLLHILLAQIQRCIDSQIEVPVSKKYIVIFKKFKNLIDQHFKSSLTTSDYAKKLNVTQHHLNYVAKEVSGKTATELIRARSILEAKRLLTFTDNNVNEIAAELGYFDSSYFAKLFKAETGTSPLAFKSSAVSDKYRLK